MDFGLHNCVFVLLVCREAAISALPVCGLRIMAAILILPEVEAIVKNITKSELQRGQRRDRLWKENRRKRSHLIGK